MFDRAVCCASDCECIVKKECARICHSSSMFIIACDQLVSINMSSIKNIIFFHCNENNNQFNGDIENGRMKKGKNTFIIEGPHSGFNIRDMNWKKNFDQFILVGNELLSLEREKNRI